MEKFIESSLRAQRFINESIIKDFEGKYFHLKEQI